MKKLTALVLALVILCSLAACGAETKPSRTDLDGKYICYQISVGGEISTPDGEWIRLDPDGTGRLCISQEADMEWELNGKNLTIKAPGGPYTGKLLEDGDIMLNRDGAMMYFSTSDKTPATEQTEPVASAVPTETEMPTEAPTETDYSTAKVIDAMAETFEFDGMTLEYYIPEIDFDGEGIDYLNEMLYRQLYEDVYKTQVVDAIEAYGMPGVAFIVYRWGISDNFLSIVVTVTPYASEGAEFSIYNVDLSNGQLASQMEVLTHFGFDIGSFTERARAVMGSVVMDQYASLLDDPSMQADFDDLMLRTTSDEYVNDAVPFVGEDGKLWMIAPIASIAGADRYMQVIAFEDYPVADAFLDGA